MTVIVLDARTGRVLRSTPIHRGYSTLTVDERFGHIFVATYYAVNGNARGLLSMLDATTGRLLRTVAASRTSVPDAVTPDPGSGRVFVAWDDRLTVHDARSGALLRTVAGVSPCSFAQPCPIGLEQQTGRVFVPDFPNVIMLDARGGAVLRVVHFVSPAGELAVDGRRGHVLVAGHGTMSMLDGGTGSLLRTTRLPFTPGQPVVDGRAGRVFAINESETGSGRVAALDTQTDALIGTTSVGSGAEEVWLGGVKGVIGPDTPLVAARSGRVFVANSRDGTVTMLDARRGSIVRRIAVKDLPRMAAVDQRAGCVFVTTQGPLPIGSQSLPSRPVMGGLRILDARTGVLLGAIPPGEGPGPVLVDGVTHRVFVLNAASGTVSVLDGCRGGAKVEG
ncbi:MAG: PQQ-binding-like beta-propeller repeat protein [Chloroflexi bacterium]|nr:PQQ-binding-like beta-propeller repeat protein [Chloroflexota bacterium]